MQAIAIEDTNTMSTLHQTKPRGRDAIEIPLSQGQALQKIIGGYMIVPGRNNGGHAFIELDPGEQLHKIPFFAKDEDGEETDTVVGFGYVVQPPGAPTLNPRGVSLKIQRSIVWVHKLTRRGPFDLYGGLQGYTMNDTGDGWIPKFGKGQNGREVMYYLSDVEEWIRNYAPPSVEEDLDKYREMEVPAGIANLFKRLAEPEQAKVGYVTRTRVMAEAKQMTKGLSEEELRSLGLEKPITDRNYDQLMAVAVQSEWGNNPKRVHNTATYRRKARGSVAS